MADHAGRWSEAVFSSNSKLVRRAEFHVYTDETCSQQATTYTDETKAEVATSHSTDYLGMAEVFADPGTYWLRVDDTNIVVRIDVLTNPLDVVQSDQLETAVQNVQSLLDDHSADTTSVHGIADTSVLETQDGAQAKANNATTAASSYAYSLLANVTRGPGVNAVTNMYHVSQNGCEVAQSAEEAADLADATEAFQALVDSVPYGSTIFFDGYIRCNSSIKWRSGVSARAAHHKAGGLVTYAVDSAAIRWNVSVDGANAGAPLTDCVFESFELDCSNQTLSGAYTVACKGFVIQYMKRSHFRNLYVHDSWATGIGVDFLQDGSTITGNIVINCGRGHSSTSPSTGSGGGAGIGIGTANTSNDEELIIAHNTVIGNGNGSVANTSYGIFLESQTGDSQSLATSGIRISDNYVSDCQIGIGDAGSRRTIVADNQVTRCTWAGIAIDGGTIGSGHPGYDNTIMGNNVYKCNAPGIRYGYLDAGGKTLCQGNTVSFCNQGIMIELAGSVGAAGMFVTENNLHDNRYSGILARYNTSGTGGITESEFSRNFIYNNGTNSSAADRDGMRFEVPLTNVKIDNNFAFDRQGTKTQRYGLITTAAATMTGGSIRNNDFRNNLTGAVSAIGTISDTTWIGQNGGWKQPGPTSVSVTSSPMTYTAPAFPTWLFVVGGTISSLTVNGASVTPNGAIPLEASDEVVIDYSSAPTLFLRGR